MSLFHHSKQTNRTTKVKICGIRRIGSATLAAEEGADYLGFNFVFQSPRYISPVVAKEIIEKVRKKSQIVGVFQNKAAHEVNEIARFLKLDFAQLHGDENNEYIKQIKIPVIKAVPVVNALSSDELLSHITQFDADHILLDRAIQGEGEIIGFEKAHAITNLFPTFLAGGLTPENITEFIIRTKPYAVDVASGIETNGVEDQEKIRQFIRNVKGVVR